MASLVPGDVGRWAVHHVKRRLLWVKRVDRSSRQGRWVIPRDRPSVSLCSLIGSFVPDRVAGCSVHLRRHRARTAPLGLALSRLVREEEH
jgi:hypothetical protein